MAKATERKAVITTEVTEDQNRITFKVRDAGELVLDLGKVNAEILTRARTHGFIQRVSDKAAIPCDTTTGLPATPAMKLEAMRTMVEHFESGASEWNIKRVEGTRKPKDGLDPIVIAAVCEVTGKDESAIRAIIEAGAAAKQIKPVAFLSALAGAGKVRTVVERMRTEQAPELDGDELLEGLGD
jgi:hypothetical protein